MFLLQYRTTPNATTGRSPAELLLKRPLRTRLTLLRPEADCPIRNAERERYETASSQVRSMEPGTTVGVLNPRPDGRGKWLPGTVTQRLGPATYLVDVQGQARHVHISQMQTRDERSRPIIIPESELPDIPTAQAPNNPGEPSRNEIPDHQSIAVGAEEQTTPITGGTTGETAPTEMVPSATVETERRYCTQPD